MSKDLIDKLLKASETIHKSSLIGSANYVITSPSVSDMIQEVYNKQKVNFRKEKVNRLFGEKV
jgi:hypothetical protein